MIFCAFFVARAAEAPHAPKIFPNCFSGLFYLIGCAAPQELIAEMAGKVWRVCVPEELVDAFQQRHRVTSINRDEENPENVLLRIVSDVSPDEGAVNVAPTLEDHYLYTYEETRNNV